MHDQSFCFLDHVKHSKLAHILASRWCQIVFVLSLILAYFLIPNSALKGKYWLLVVMFVPSFAASVTCSVRSFKDHIQAGLKQKTSLLSILAGLIGVSAVQFCSVNAVMCGSTLGVGLLSGIMPHFMFRWFHQYAPWLLGVSVLAQWMALYSMGCLGRAKIRLETKSAASDSTDKQSCA